MFLSKIIVEGSNGSVTPTANDYLCKKGVVIIPDIIARAGGAIISYLEWVKNINHQKIGMLRGRL